MKNTKGITLVALVVTIVVLIILAGVSINLVLGDNAVIKRATTGADDYKQAQANEIAMMNETTIDDLIGSTVTTVKPGESGYVGGSYDEPYIPTGFTHTGTDTWNSGYTIKETATGNEFVWVPCVLDQSKVKAGDSVVTFTKTTTGRYNSNSLGLLPTDTSVAEEDSSVAEIKTSVGQYGGFYIAKYEAGVPGTTQSTTTNDTNKQTVNGSVKPVSKPNVGVWNYITRANAITVSKAMIDTASTGAKSTLISGECWDTTLQWMVNASSNKTTNAGYDINSTGRGNYTGTIATTANKTEYAINNIYDMAGNVWEWTTENCTFHGYAYLVYRGGDYKYSGSDSPAAYRNGSYDNSDIIIGFRPVLYK